MSDDPGASKILSSWSCYTFSMIAKADCESTVGVYNEAGDFDCGVTSWVSAISVYVHGP